MNDTAKQMDKIEEKEITEAVVKLFNQQSKLEHKYEVQFCSKYLDLLSYDCTNGEYIAVESKVNSVSRAFNQAKIYRHLAAYVYVAMMKNSSNKKAIELANNTGIGLILIERDSSNNYKAHVNVPATYSSLFDNEISKYVWKQYNWKVQYAQY